MDAKSQEDGKRRYTTPRWVQVWFLQRSRDNWKRKYMKLKADAKRLQNRVNDVTHSRENWRKRMQELEAQNAAEQEQARVIVLANSNVGAAVGSRLSVRLKASLATNVVELPKISGDSFTVRRGAYSGKAFADMTLSGERKIIAVKKNSMEAAHEAGKTAEVVAFQAQLTDADFADAPTQVVMQEQTGGVLLPEAELVVSGGRGMKGPENWGLIEDLAKALGAATACSKPVSDVDWRPHHEHVGQTGITVSPNLYIACGISGAIQHLAGVNSSKVIVVINKDPEAPFFKAADYGIVGDVFDVLPKLTQAVKELG